RFPQPVAISPDGASAYVGHFVSPGVGGVSIISTATNTVTTTVIVGNQPSGIAFTPNGAFAYVANFVGSSVSVIDTATTTVVATISSASARTPNGIAITPDGAFAYSANFNSNNVSVIDTATNTIVALIPGFIGPAAIALPVPARNRAPVAKCHNVTVSAGPDCTANASIDDGSFDPDTGDTITITQSPAGPYPVGTTTVTLTVTDNHGASSQCSSTVTVVDTTPPTLTLKPSIGLWPPNHQYHTVTTADMVAAVSDSCSSIGLNNVVITQVTSDEGSAADNDIVIAPDCSSVQLRAERDGG